jgi:hypothetical protein
LSPHAQLEPVGNRVHCADLRALVLRQDWFPRRRFPGHCQDGGIDLLHLGQLSIGSHGHSASSGGTAPVLLTTITVSAATMDVSQ